MTTGTSPQIDVSVAHPARRYNYWLGGKDHFAADRASGDAIAREYPQVKTDAVENRRWVQRVTRYLAEMGMRQFIDIGVGLPLDPNVHDIAQGINPYTRVLYVDNDPLVMSHARALLTSTLEGRTDYAEIDVRQPDEVLHAAEGMLDFHQPIAVLMVALVHFIPDDAQAYHIVHTLVDGLPDGSVLALSQSTADGLPRHTQKTIADLSAAHGPFRARSREQFERFFSGLTLLDPGITRITQWHPDEATGDANVYGALARKGR